MPALIEACAIRDSHDYSDHIATLLSSQKSTELLTLTRLSSDEGLRVSKSSDQ